MIQLNETEVVALMDFYGGMRCRLERDYADICNGDDRKKLDAYSHEISWIDNRLHEIENEIN